MPSVPLGARLRCVPAFAKSRPLFVSCACATVSVGASVAQTSRLCMEPRKAERERDAVANEMRWLCRG